MKKYQNPFWALDEANDVLRLLGINCLEDGWAENILGIRVERTYEDNYDYYHTVSIQLDIQGFQMLMDAIRERNPSLRYVTLAERVHFDEVYDRFVYRPGDHLEIDALVLKTEVVSV